MRLVAAMLDRAPEALVAPWGSSSHGGEATSGASDAQVASLRVHLIFEDDMWKARFASDGRVYPVAPFMRAP